MNVLLPFTGSFNDDVVGVVLIADYCLYWMNKRGIFSYVDVLSLPAPCDDINEVLIRVAVTQNYFLSVNTFESE